MLNIKIAEKFNLNEHAVIFHGSCLELLKDIPDKSIQLVVTSPPYNIGKEYEKKLRIDTYLEQQAEVIRECVRCLSDSGSICWQVGNYVQDSSIIPLDIILFPIFREQGLVMRNRIVWHFEHGLHCSRRFPGRYETIIWFTHDTKDYVFNLDPVRVPQKYPGKKYFKGPKAGQYSCNPLGKNPGDVWDIPNVKSNHVEKTAHPCQFPAGLIERLVLSMTNEGDWVLDPFLGAGTSVIAAIRHGRRGVGAEIEEKYIDIAKMRVRSAIAGTLKVRPMNKPKYDPRQGNKVSTLQWEESTVPYHQMVLLRVREIITMKIAEVYSHLNGLEFLLVHKKDLWEEVQYVISRVDASVCKTKVSKEKTMKGKLLYSPIEMNRSFKELLTTKGWRESRVNYWVTSEAKLIRKTLSLAPEEQKKEIEASGYKPIFSYNQTDFVKDWVAIEVQFGKYAFVAYDLFVKHLAFYVGDKIDVGIEILPMKTLQFAMSSGVAYYEGELYNLIRQGRGVPAVPLVIVGIES